ncbi:MAG TPA: PDZ domain-containing protein, partial [Aquihabitans sp.]|nr:PDZ domain-containing protein [Aquihabitans sp.]
RSLGRRATVGDHVVHDAIQLDRPVPADAHGGALVDADGALLGLVVGNSTERELGTVVPADDAVDCALALRDHGTVRRAWLGVRAVDLDPDEATLLGVPGGARITEVTLGSPAAAAGVRVGDVVRAVDQHVVDDASDLVNDLADREPGEAVDLHVQRDGQQLGLPITLGG